MQGWICLHRRILEWEWYSDINTRCLFIHCLLRANHSDTRWKGQEIKRGQFITSLDSLSKETGLTISQVRTSIRKLEMTSEIASKSQAKNRVITVIGYDSYQASRKQDDNEIASKSQANEQANDKQIATDNNDNNEQQVKQKRKGSRFTPPTLEEVKDYCLERKNQVNPIRFVNYYESNGWSVGKNKMKCWKAAVRNWETKESNSRPVQQDLSQQNFVSGKF